MGHVTRRSALSWATISLMPPSSFGIVGLGASRTRILGSYRWIIRRAPWWVSVLCDIVGKSVFSLEIILYPRPAGESLKRNLIFGLRDRGEVYIYIYFHGIIYAARTRVHKSISSLSVSEELQVGRSSSRLETVRYLSILILQTASSSVRTW